MRLCTWNLRSGGKSRTAGIASALASVAPDLALLTEYRPSAGLLPLLGPGFSIESSPAPAQNGLLAHSRVPLRRGRGVVAPTHSHRWLHLSLPDHRLHVLGVHVPNMGEKWNKAEFWERISAFALWATNRRAVVMGDLNTALLEDCEGTYMSHQAAIQCLLDAGWKDAWRAANPLAKEYSWYSPNAGNGYRLDHCFVSPRLAKDVVGAHYEHGPRVDRLSDHSMLVVDLVDRAH